MKIHSEINLTDFKFWSGARDRAKELTYEQLDELDRILDMEYPDGMEDGKLNDLFWFEEDFIAELLGFSSFEELVRYNNSEDVDDDDELDGTYKGRRYVRSRGKMRNRRLWKVN